MREAEAVRQLAAAAGQAAALKVEQEVHEAAVAAVSAREAEAAQRWDTNFLWLFTTPHNNIANIASGSGLYFLLVIYGAIWIGNCASMPCI